MRKSFDYRIMAFTYLLLVLVLGLFILYEHQCRIETGLFIEQEFRNTGLKIQTTAGNIFFEGKNRKLDFDKYQPVALKYCPTIAGDRVKAVIGGN